MIDARSILESAGDPATLSAEAFHAGLMRAMVVILRPFVTELPPVGEAALALAEQIWVRGDRDVDSLTSARVACWAYLDGKNGNSSAIGDREDRVMRALLCVLEPQPRNDPGTTAEWFIEVLGN